MKIKKCTICSEELPLERYYSYEKETKKKGKYIYYYPYCIDCAKKKSDKWNKDNVQDYNRNMRNFYKDNKELYRKCDDDWRRKGGLKEWQRKNKDRLKEYRVKRGNKKHDISPQEWDDCKNYFNNECAYCGLHISLHFIASNGERKLSDLHREHVDHTGANDLSNCVPSCRSCNSKKRNFPLEEWYTEENRNYKSDRLNKINKWLEQDYKKVIKSI